MANLRNESRFHKKYTKTNMGGKIPKRGPKGWLIYGMNPSCIKKYTKTKIGPKEKSQKEAPNNFYFF